MAVQFILGRSGTGKTGYCIKAIIEALLESSGQPLVLLVPEQATYQAERAILSDRRIAGYNGLHVLSFDRLQFLLLGKNTARPALSRIGRQMVVHRILRDGKSKLEIFHTSAGRPGLARQIADTIAELHHYAKTPEDIDRLLQELRKDERNSLTAQKFIDIGLVFKEYLKFVEGRFIDPDVQLARARLAVSKADFVRGARLWVDGFAGFTGSELEILAELLKVVAEAQIALCLDPKDFDLSKPDIGSFDPAGLFYPTQVTYAGLVEIIKKSRVTLAKPIILKETRRFSSCPQLAHIERCMFTPKPAKVAAADSVRIVSAPNERAEAEFAARQIIELVREKGCRYRDIAVIASDIERYQHYIRASFDDYGVPFFIDKRKPLDQHPVVQLICSALQAVTGGFSSSDIFAYLKTDLVPVGRSDIDLLENYCIAYGINAGDWQSDKRWNFAVGDGGDFDERQINEIRLKAAGPLLELGNKFYSAQNTPKTLIPEGFARAVFDFLDALQVRRTLGTWIEEATERKDYAAIDRHQQFYDSLVNVVDELVEVFAGQNITAEDYSAILDSAFSQMTLAFIPPTLDQVLVGSIERSRHPDLKAVFLIGATQKQFPTPVGFDSVLTDDDRRTAEEADFPLAETSWQKLAKRQYLAYIAFTRPCEFLCITYPAVDSDGSAVARSQFIDELQLLFENLEEESVGGRQTDIENVGSESEIIDILCTGLGRDAPAVAGGSSSRLADLLEDVCSDEELGHLGAAILSSLNYENRAQLDSGVVAELFGRHVKSSATRLGDFAKCPYKHFVEHILELRERKEFKFEPLDVGNFYHNVLDALLKTLNEKKKDFAAVRDEQLLAILRENIAKLRQTHPFVSNFVRRSAHNAYIISSASEVLEDCILAIAQMVRAGGFRPAMSEVAFGRVEGACETLGEFELALSNGGVLSLGGKIDRLDIADIEGRKFAIIFDYKRKAESFRWPDFYYGLDMQLPIYMLAVRNASRSRVKDIAGAFYMPVEAKVRASALTELPQAGARFSRKAKGIFNGEFAWQLDARASKDSKFYNFFVTKEGEPYGNYGGRDVLRRDDFENVLRFAGKKVVRIAEEIVSGKIDVWPYRIDRRSPCNYCKYKAVCRFDWQINDYNALESIYKPQALEEMRGVNA